MIWQTSRLELRVLDEKSAPDVFDYRLRNRSHLLPWEPLRPERSVEEWEVELKQRRQEYENQQGLHLAVRLKDSITLIGLIHFSNVVRGFFQACHLGFSLDHDSVARGYMHEALEGSLKIIFGEWELHRVMANHLPENIRSEVLLKKLGFNEEGYAKRYLKINGEWRDHILRSKLNPVES